MSLLSLWGLADEVEEMIENNENSDPEEKQSEVPATREEEVDPFLNPKVASEDWELIQLQYKGKERKGLPFEWGKLYPWLEIETRVPEDRLEGPRVRCHYCYRNKPIGRSEYQRLKNIRSPLAQVSEADPLPIKKKGVQSIKPGRPLKGLLKRSCESHAISGFHAEKYKTAADAIIKKRKRKFAAKEENKELEEKKRKNLSRINCQLLALQKQI